MYLAVTYCPTVKVAENGDTRQPNLAAATALSHFNL